MKRGVRQGDPAAALLFICVYTIMMDDAERAYDGGMMRQQRQLGGLMADEEANTTTTGGLDQDLMKAMSLKANKAPSLS